MVSIFMTTFLALWLAHLLADFPLQTNRVFRLKIASNAGLAFHVLLHLLMTALLVQQPANHLSLFVVLGVVHFLIDWTKLRLPSNPQWPGFLLDQLAHLVSLALLAQWQMGIMVALSPWLMVPLILLVLLPAMLMLLWVWARDMEQDGRYQESRSVHWASRRLLTLSQQTGWVALLLVVACRFVG